MAAEVVGATGTAPVRRGTGSEVVWRGGGGAGIGPVWRGTGGMGAPEGGVGNVDASIGMVTAAWGRVGNAVVGRVSEGIWPEAETRLPGLGKVGGLMIFARRLPLPPDEGVGNLATGGMGGAVAEAGVGAGGRTGAIGSMVGRLGGAIDLASCGTNSSCGAWLSSMILVCDWRRGVFGLLAQNLLRKRIRPC